MSQSQRLSPSLGTAPCAAPCRPRGSQQVPGLGVPMERCARDPTPPDAPSPQDEPGSPCSLQGHGGAGEGSVLPRPLGVRFQRCLCQVLLTGSPRAGPCCWRGRWWHRRGPACAEQSRGGARTRGSRPRLPRAAWVMLGSARLPARRGAPAPILPGAGAPAERPAPAAAVGEERCRAALPRMNLQLL